VKNADDVTLVAPCIELCAAFVDMAEEFLAAGEEHWACDLPEVRKDPAAFVRRLRNQSQGKGLAAGLVPATYYWLVRDDVVIGRANLRHRLNEKLEHEGGHIGYAIRPSERGKGYGTRQLALALEKARQLGLLRVLVTCDDDHVASARVIETNGGILEDVRVSHETGKDKRRYWIDLA
jgi:predicted acetyltransferase